MQTIIKTMYGHVAFTPTDISHIYIELAPASPDLDDQGRKYSLPFTVRGVSYYGSIHVYRWDDGQFRIGRNASSYCQARQSIFLRRHNPNHPSNDHAANLPNVLSFKHLSPLVNTWAATNPYSLDAAQREHTASALEGLEAQRVHLLAELSKVEAQIAELRPNSGMSQLTAA